MINATRLLCLLLLFWVAADSSSARTVPQAVVVVVDPAVRHPISRFIYGLNFAESKTLWGSDVPQGITLNRMGGNRLSAYNWETNASNCGNDCNGTFPNDAYLADVGTPPAHAVHHRLQWAVTHQSAFLATVPMLGFVAADTAGPVPLTTPLTQRRISRFLVSAARNSGKPSSPPNLGDRTVYQDQYVSHLESAFPKVTALPETPLWYSLDNEPDLWGSTHEVVRGNRLGPNDYVLTGYEELTRLSAEYAAAIKGVAPKSLVFGPAVANWNGMANLFHNRTPDPAGKQFFLEYYLDRMREAETAYGHRLLDVLDVHWYAESLSTQSQSVSNEWAPQDAAMVQARVQAPRSLWDPSFVERSWVTRASNGAVRLIPRLREMIAQHYPGTRIAITEYFFHRGGDISGALAQADALGIFGQEDLFAAALWPQGSAWAYKGNVPQTYACVLAAFRSFRNYDGAGSAFGDVSLQARTSDPQRVSVYASADTTAEGRYVFVAINKSEGAISTTVNLNVPEAAGAVEVWQLTGGIGRCTGPVRVGDARAVRGTVQVTLPPLSVSTLVLPRGAPLTPPQ